MDGDLGAMLESVLADPQQMEKIAQMAKGLMGGEPPSPPEETKSAEPSRERSPEINGELFSALGKMFSGREEKTRSTALLMAMRPYMRPEKQEKLDRAMKIARMVHVAGAVMNEYGGGFHGI